MTNSSNVTPSTPLKVHSFARTPGQAYLKRGLPFVQRLDSGSTRRRFPQIGQYIRPDSRALVFLWGLLYFSAISSNIFCVSTHFRELIKPSWRPTETIHSLIGFLVRSWENFGLKNVESSSSTFIWSVLL